MVRGETALRIITMFYELIAPIKETFSAVSSSMEQKDPLRIISTASTVVQCSSIPWTWTHNNKKTQLRCYHLITSGPADVDDHHTKTDLSSARIEDLNHATKSISHWRWRTTRSLSPTGVGLDDLLRHKLITIWGDFEPFYRFLDFLCYFVTRLLSVFSVRKNDARHFKISINRVCISSSLLRKPSICKQNLRSVGPPSSHHKTKFVTLELLPPKSIAKRLGTFT